MDSSDSASTSPESRAIRRHFSSLAKAITDPLGLSMELFSEEIIEKVTLEKVKLPNQTDREKSSVLLSTVMERVKARPSLFHRFIDLLKDNEDHTLRDLGGKLKTTYSEYYKQFIPENEQRSSAHHLSRSTPSTKQIHIKYLPTQQVHSLPTPAMEQINFPSPPPTQQIHFQPPPPIQQIYSSPPPLTQQIHSQPPLSTQQIYSQPPPPTQEIHSPPPPPTQQIHFQPPPPTQQIHSQPPLSTQQIHFQPPPLTQQIHSQPPPLTQQIHSPPPLPTQQIHSQSAPLTQQIHSPPPPPIQQIHSPPPPLTQQIHSQPPPSTQQVHSQPPPPTQQIQSLPPPPTQQIHSQPPPLTQQIHSPPPPPTQQIHSQSAPPTQQIHSPPPPPTQQIHSPPPLPTEQVDCSPPPSAIHPSLLLLPQESPVCRYAKYLRAFYQTSELPANDKWPPSPSEIFINLTVISREKVSHTDMMKIMLASLQGNVDQILNIKAPIEIGKILSSRVLPGKALQCVLVEGAPGVGKSTLAWEVCKQWGKGVSNQQFAIVMLLRLRDQTVQNAQSISDLIFYRHNQEEISQYLDHIEGRDILIILEGLDELPKHLLTQSSIFTDLLSGKELPHATILVTSRPSATVQLWNKWKHRISQHIEVLGFTQENIDQYTASVLFPQQLSDFQEYLSINPHIRTIMYIPLHAAIVTEVYQMCQDSSRTLPTTITELYTCFVQTVLLRYITSQPDYRGEQVDLDKFTDLPPPVYDLFYKLTQLAYNGVIDQQLIFEHQAHTIHHLGFMKAVTELFPNKLAVTYSYSFLHFSIQEYLAAYYVSTMEIPQQEQLLRRMCAETHLQNMGRFVAGITKFAGMDMAIVKNIIEEECKSTVETDWLWKPSEKVPVQLSTHAIQLLYESGDASILDSNQFYGCPLTDHNPPFDFSTLGYCITHSNCKWILQLGTDAQRIKSPEGIEELVKALRSHSKLNNTYSIERISLYYDDPECVEQLFTMPENILQQVEGLRLDGNDHNHQPLPQCVAGLPLTMNILRTLALWNATGATAVHKTVQAMIRTNTLEGLELTFCDIDYGCVTTLYGWLLTSSKLGILKISLPSTKAIELILSALQTNSTVMFLGLQGSKFSLPAAQALCSMLTHNKTITHVNLWNCHIDDDIISCLAEGLHNNNTLRVLDIMYNSITDRGAVCVAEMLKINDTLQRVVLLNNPIGLRGQSALKTIEETTNKVIELDYKELNDLKETCSKCKQM